MNKRTQQRLTVLGGIFIIITAIYFAKDSVQNFFANKPTAAFPQLNSSQITELSITNDTTETKIYKKNKDWYTQKDSQEFKADRPRIENILKSITTLLKEDVVSRNTEKHKELGIDKQKIVFKTGNTNNTIYIGKPTGSKNFIRIGSQSEVFTASGFSDIDFSGDYRDSSINKVEDEKKE